MKYILKKDLPLAKAGTEVDVQNGEITKDLIVIAYIDKNNTEWLEEIKEKKTIYDLKEGYTYWNILPSGFIQEFKKERLLEVYPFNNFLSEREAKRNKLLRELATRTDKWLPKNNDKVIIPDNSSFNEEYFSEIMIILYHMGLVFRNEEEYNLWMTEEAKDLLFNI